jgi:hypothetical protein
MGGNLSKIIKGYKHWNFLQKMLPCVFQDVGQIFMAFFNISAKFMKKKNFSDPNL